MSLVKMNHFISIVFNFLNSVSSEECIHFPRHVRRENADDILRRLVAHSGWLCKNVSSSKHFITVQSNYRHHILILVQNSRLRELGDSRLSHDYVERVFRCSRRIMCLCRDRCNRIDFTWGFGRCYFNPGCAVFDCKDENMEIQGKK